MWSLFFIPDHGEEIHCRFLSANNSGGIFINKTNAMRLLEQIDGYIETDVQNKDARMVVKMDRKGINPIQDEIAYDVYVTIELLSLDNVTDTLKDLYSKLPVEFLSAVEAGDKPTFMFLKPIVEPLSVKYKIPNTEDYIDLTSKVSGVSPQGIFRVDNSEEGDLHRSEFLSAVNYNFRSPVQVSTDILKWYDNVKRSVSTIEGHIRRLKIENVRKSIWVDPTKDLSQKPFTYSVRGMFTSDTLLKSEDEVQKYNTFLTSLLSEYGVNVLIEPWPYRS